MSVESISITVRYSQGTFLARAKGCKQTASCVYDAGLAAKALARKLGFDPDRHWAGTDHRPTGSVYLFARGEEE